MKVWACCEQRIKEKNPGSAGITFDENVLIQARIGVARVLLETDKFSKAISILEETKQLVSNKVSIPYQQILIALANIYLQMESFKKALEVHLEYQMVIEAIYGDDSMQVYQFLKDD